MCWKEFLGGMGWLNGKEHSMNICSINKCIQMHCLKNTYLGASQKVLPEPLKSVYSTVTYIPKKKSVFIKSSLPSKMCFFNSIQTFKEDDPHHYNYSRNNITTPKRAQFWRTNRSNPSCVNNYFGFTVDTKNICK